MRDWLGQGGVADGSLHRIASLEEGAASTSPGRFASIQRTRAMILRKWTSTRRRIRPLRWSRTYSHKSSVSEAPSSSFLLPISRPSSSTRSGTTSTPLFPSCIARRLNAPSASASSKPTLHSAAFVGRSFAACSVNTNKCRSLCHVRHRSAISGRRAPHGSLQPFTSCRQRAISWIRLLPRRVQLGLSPPHLRHPV